MSLEQTATIGGAGISDEYMDKSFTEMRRIIREVGPYITQRAGKASNIEVKSDGSPVTPDDIEVERIICVRMREVSPLIPVFGEETGYDEYNLPETCWLVDPIDGTKSYIKGEAMFTTMAMLVRQGQTVAAIIYNPTTREEYTAWQGKGAYRNNERITLTNNSLPATLYCKQEFSELIDKALRDAGIAVTTEPAPGGGGYGFTKVLDGTAAARANMLGGGQLHDYAPGGLLVQEAGGVNIPIQGDEYTMHMRSFVAAHPALAAVFADIKPAIQELEQQVKARKLQGH